MSAQEWETLSHLGITVTVIRSEGPDAAPVVFVDTESKTVPEGEKGPEIRIRLNDEPVFVGKDYEPADD